MLDIFGYIAIGLVGLWVLKIIFVIIVYLICLILIHLGIKADRNLIKKMRQNKDKQ